MTLALLKQFKERLISILGYVLMVVVALLVFDVLWGVFSRYVMGAQSSWTEELARFLLVWVVMLGGASAFAGREHLGLDYFVDKMDPVTQRKMRYFVDVATLFFTLSILLWGGMRLTIDTFALGQMLMALGIPKGYVYLAIPVSGIFFLVFAIEDMLAAMTETDEEGDEA